MRLRQKSVQVQQRPSDDDISNATLMMGRSEPLITMLSHQLISLYTLLIRPWSKKAAGYLCILGDTTQNWMLEVLL